MLAEADNQQFIAKLQKVTSDVNCVVRCRDLDNLLLKLREDPIETLKLLRRDSRSLNLFNLFDLYVFENKSDEVMLKKKLKALQYGIDRSVEMCKMNVDKMKLEELV